MYNVHVHVLCTVVYNVHVHGMDVNIHEQLEGKTTQWYMYQADSAWELGTHVEFHGIPASTILIVSNSNELNFLITDKFTCTCMCTFTFLKK